MTQTPTYHVLEVQCDCYSIIPHTTKPSVLLLLGENGWSLPHFVPIEQHFGFVGHINQAMQIQLGIDVTVLRCVLDNFNRETQHINRVYALDNHSPSWTPPAEGRWINSTEIDRLDLGVPEHQAVLAAWFNEAEGGDIPALRSPWAISGWFEEVAVWIQAQLDRHCLTATTPIEQLKTWAISCILRVGTTAGYLYFKASPPVFACEPQLTQTLAEFYPAHFPKVLAVDRDRYWILMQDFGGQLLTKVTDIAIWEKALRRFAQIQIDCIERLDKLIALGLPDRRLDKLAAQIDLLFADTFSTLSGSSKGLSETEILQLRALAPKLAEMCEKLASYGVPHTLVHDDFWDGNIGVTDESYIYFDWSYSCLSHPFFDLAYFLEEIDEIENLFVDIPDVRSRLCHAYLEPWTIFEPMDRLIAAFELSQTVGLLYGAFCSHQLILNLEAKAKWEMEEKVPFYIKRLLQVKTAL